MKNKVLTSEELTALLRRFKEERGAEYHLLALGYFGSYARGTARPDSDVDVVFDTNYPDLFATALMKEDLQDFLKRPVDVIRLRERMNPRFKQRIEQEAIYV